MVVEFEHGEFSTESAWGEGVPLLAREPPRPTGHPSFVRRGAVLSGVVGYVGWLGYGAGSVRELGE